MKPRSPWAAPRPPTAAVPLREPAAVQQAYRGVLLVLLLPLALVVGGLLAANVSQAYGRWQRAMVWERRRMHAAEVSRSFHESGASGGRSESDTLADTLLAAMSADADGGDGAAAEAPPLLRRLHRLDDGVSAWEAYASDVEAALRAAGCADDAFTQARQWLRPTFVGRRRPDALVLNEALETSKPQRACAVVYAEAAAAAQLHRDIAASQTLPSPADCASPDARFLLLDYPRNGFTSNFGVVAGALITARRLGRLLVLNERVRWVYYGGERLCEGFDGAAAPQWECYFRRFGTCDFGNSGITDDDIAAAPPATEVVAAETAPGGSAASGPRVVRMSQEPQFAGLFYHGPLSRLEPPPPYGRYGNAWWRTHHFLHLWRLQPRLARAVARRLAASGLPAALESDAGARVAHNGSAAAAGQPQPGDFIAWHVRHGDKVREAGRRIYRTSQYLPTLSAVTAAHPGVTAVLLSSDDPHVVEEASALRLFKRRAAAAGSRGAGAAGGYLLYSLPDARRLGGQVVEAAAVAEADPVAAFTLAVDAIANVCALSEASLSVGTFHSNFGRLATELRYAKGYLAAPPALRDALDCARAGHVHPDRDSYFVPNATRWYLPLRAARRSLGLPRGYFLPPPPAAAKGTL